MCECVQYVGACMCTVCRCGCMCVCTMCRCGCVCVCYLQVQVDHVVPVQEAHSLQDLSHQLLHLLLSEGLIPLSHTLVKDLSPRRAGHTQTQTHTRRHTC